MFNIVKILEKVDMIAFHIHYYGNGGEKFQKGVAIFAGLQNDRVSLADAVASADKGERSAYHNRRVGRCGHGNVGEHRGGCGFSVGAGNAHGVFIPLHNGAPALCPRKNGDSELFGLNYLGIVVLYGGRADDIIGLSYVLGKMAHINFHLLSRKAFGGRAALHIRAGYFVTAFKKGFGQRAH